MGFSIVGDKRFIWENISKRAFKVVLGHLANWRCQAVSTMCS
jgi:hypothetical protein